MIFKPANTTLPAGHELPAMTHEKAIEIISDIGRGIYTSNHSDTKEALRMAMVALIAEKLHLDV